MRLLRRKQPLVAKRIWKPSGCSVPSKKEKRSRKNCFEIKNRKSEIVNFTISILVKPNTKVLVQGITGSFGAKHAQLSIDYGTQIVAGVTPGKGGQFFEHGGKKIPIFDTLADAVKQTGATARAVFVPPPFAADA